MREEEFLCDIDYVSSDDLEFLDSYNRTEYPMIFEDIIDAFNFNLFKNPDKDLVRFKDKAYTYGEGAFIASELAGKLNGLDIGVGDNVAFLVERSELYMFCILGVLATGAAYVPLDDAHPDERLKFILDDTGSKVIIVSDETYGRAKELAGEEIVLLNISDIVNGEFGSSSSLPVVKSDIACILYTSGSTGLPKGVKITKDAILNSVESYAKLFDITNEDVYGLFATIGVKVSTVALA